ncbi:acyl-CoA dehydrogenase family protein [Streptococcus dentapri]|uniref:Acyl-CoA dehydrogenase family protein n=1 Tax=Streptococcus dentapri TaxID=573564 RepID=A0ABV8CYS3_9STRE
MTYLSKEFTAWLEANAQDIDQESGGSADELLTRIAEEGVFKIGVPTGIGGSGGTATDVIDALSELGRYSLSAAFIGWGHRTLINNILESSNTYLRDTWLPELLTGKLAGGTGLSNAIKFLSKIEELNVKVIEKNGRRYLRGCLPWVTNVRSDNFAVLFAAGCDDKNKEPLVLAVPQSAGIERSSDLEFMALQGANTASLTFDDIVLDDHWILSENGSDFIAQTRPTFLGYQFGLAFGLAHRSLDEVASTLSRSRLVLKDEYEAVQAGLNRIQTDLYTGLEDNDYFIHHPRELFQLRIDIVDVVTNALLLELQSSGGRAYFKNSSSGFARRWKEGAFLPIVSPSAVQLRHILAVS